MYGVTEYGGGRWYPTLLIHVEAVCATVQGFS